MKIATLFLLNLLVVSWPELSKAQTVEYQVISTTGLNLRTAPDPGSKILKTLPYGTRIQMLKDSIGTLDTLKTNRFYGSEGYEYVSHLRGRWAKVEHDETVGYVFNAFIDYYYDRPYIREVFPKLNQSVRLLPVGESCEDVYRYDPALNWYGLYLHDGKMELRPVRVSQYRIIENEGGLMTNCTSTDDNRHLRYLIGSEKVLPTGSKPAFAAANWYEENFANFPELSTTFTEGTPDRCDLNVQLGLHGNFGAAVCGYDYHSVLFKGDLNGDGLPDYIVCRGDTTSTHVLYFNTRDDSGVRLEPVAALQYGPCC